MNRKRILAWILSLAMIITLLPATAFADEATAQDADAGIVVEEVVLNEPAVTLEDETTDNRITFTGDEVGFYKEDGVSSFGMLSLQDGSKVVVDGDQVKIYNIPSNKSVYDGLHWGFITDTELTKDVLALENGCWYITVSTENCGYGVPVAPVKTEARGGGTTSAQYYLCIPSLDKLKAIANYSKVDAALATVPADTSAYTEESVAALTTAVSATEAQDFRYYNVDEQATVDAAAAAIETAVAGLEKAESFGFTLQVGQYTEGADFHTASFDGVTYSLKDESGNVYEPSSTTTGMLTYRNLDASKTYTFTASKEGWAVVTQGDWDVDAHAYIYTYTGATEIVQTITKDDAGKNITEATNPGMIFRIAPREENEVDKALASVPTDLNYDLFTDATANALKDAVAAADPTVEDTEKLAAMAQAITTALQGLIPKDGKYEVSIEKYNGTPYYLYEGLGDSDKTSGKAVLNVENGQMTADIVLKNQSYGQVALGTKDEVIEAATAAGAVPEGTIDLVMPAEKAAYNGKEYSITTGTIPVPALQTKIAYAYHSSNSKYTYNTGWYDHGVMYLANSLTPISEEIEDGITNLSIYDEELMFKVVNAYVEKEGDKTELVFALSAKGYEEIYAGTYDEAIANGNNKDNWIKYSLATVDCVYETKSGVQNDGTAEKYQFRVPVTLDESGVTRVPIVAISHSRQEAAETANPENPDYSNAFTARQFVIDMNAKTIRTGNYQDTLEAAVSSTIDTMKVESAGEIYTIGTPTANEYTRQGTFTLSDTTYDAYFKGTAEDAAAASDITTVGTDKKVTLTYKNSLGKDPEIDVTTGKVNVAFRVAATQEWIDTEIVIDPDAKTITISGEEDDRIVYTGDEVGFYKEDGVSAFGMLSPQDGSKVVVDGDQVKIYIIPSNKTVYDGIHWGFITDTELTKDVQVLDNGCWYITVSTENCGYGVPVAPVKKKDGKTTSAQYYLCIPSLEKLKAIADYSKVDAALAAVPADTSIYTEESVAALTEAVSVTEAQDFRYYNVDEQAVVDAAASAIETAVAGLKEKKAEWVENDGKYRYVHADGTYKTSGWEEIDGAWYLFDADGYRQTGWKQSGSKWYYMNTEGKMLTGWQQINNKWYYLGAAGDGAMKSGWQQINNKWYYFGAASDGAMKSGWQQINNKWYYLGAASDGAMKTGWQQINSKWYYFNTSGAMQTGWQQINNKWYYFNTSGAMQTGWIKVDGKSYYMYSDGHMATSTWIGNYYVNASGVWTKSK